MAAEIVAQYSFMSQVYRPCGCRASCTRWRHTSFIASDDLSEVVECEAVECGACGATWQTIAVRRSENG